MTLLYGYLNRHCEQGMQGILLRGPVKPTVSQRGLLTRSIKIINKYNDFSILTESRGQAMG